MLLGEVQSIVNNDGAGLDLSDGGVWVRSFAGYGAPPISFVSRRGYKHHGEEVEAVLVEPRPISLQLFAGPNCTRTEYWARRAQIIDMMRPNRVGPFSLMVVLPNGERRSIEARPDPGPIFPSKEQDNSWNVDDSMQLICHTPIWIDPQEHTVELTRIDDFDEELVFPATFPIYFGGSYRSVSSGTITYTGTWDSYLQVRIAGPYQFASIEIPQTGGRVELSVPILFGEARLVDIRPPLVQILDESGEDRTTEMGGGSVPLDLRFRPHPLVTDGEHEVIVNVLEGDEDPYVHLIYHDRYFGI